MRGEYVSILCVCVYVWKFDKSEEEILNIRIFVSMDLAQGKEFIQTIVTVLFYILWYHVLEELPVLKVKMRK